MKVTGGQQREIKRPEKQMVYYNKKRVEEDA